MKRIKVCLVAGARPNFIKIAPLIKSFNLYNSRNFEVFKNLYPHNHPYIKTDDNFFPDIFFETTLIHTGQHYDKNMSETFFRELEIPEPEVNFGVGGKRDLIQIAEMLLKFEGYFSKNNFQLVILVGDVNSTLASSIAASRFDIPVAHVEAGLRSFDRKMPEEINRIVTDSISDYFFISEKSGIENLLDEGKRENFLFFCGNVMIDSLIENLDKIRDNDFYKNLELEEKNFVILTLHRPSNVDSEKKFKEIISAIVDSNIPYPVIYPIHPRSKKNILKFKMESYFKDKFEKGRISLIEPIGYHEFLNLLNYSKFVLSDSGGIQEETSFLNIPCITLRENTERPVTIELGTNFLGGTNYSRIKSIIKKVLEGNFKNSSAIPLWDGRSGKRIVKHIAEIFGS